MIVSGMINDELEHVMCKNFINYYLKSQVSIMVDNENRSMSDT